MRKKISPISYTCTCKNLKNTSKKTMVYFSSLGPGATLVYAFYSNNMRCKCKIPCSSSGGDGLALAGSKCSIRPSRTEPSNSEYALAACSGITNITVPKPLGFRVTLSIGRFTSAKGPNQKFYGIININND